MRGGINCEERSLAQSVAAHRYRSALVRLSLRLESLEVRLADEIDWRR